MSNDHVIRAWKDTTYRSNLSETERAALPPHPSGPLELCDEQLDAIAGGYRLPTALCSVACTWQPAGCGGGQTNAVVWCPW